MATVAEHRRAPSAPTTVRASTRIHELYINLIAVSRVRAPRPLLVGDYEPETTTRFDRSTCGEDLRLAETA
jgi:hypothetical protein